MSGVNYKGLTVYDGNPIGAAGLAINNNFKSLADDAIQSWKLVSSTRHVMGPYDEYMDDPIQTIAGGTFSSDDEALIVAYTLGTGGRGGLGIILDSESLGITMGPSSNTYKHQAHLKEVVMPNTAVRVLATFTGRSGSFGDANERQALLTRSIADELVINFEYLFTSAPPGEDDIVIEVWKRTVA